jgi:hypothetical protein
MTGFVDVTDHPYHAVTDVDGAYEMRDVPPGTYTLEVWHEELSTLTKSVVVEAGATTTVDFRYTPPAAGRDSGKEGGR